MPIFIVSVDLELAVEAKNQAEAERIASNDGSEEWHNAVFWAHEAKELKDVHVFADSIPWGGKGDKTCREIFEEAEEAERKRPPTAEEIEAAGQLRLIA